MIYITGDVHRNFSRIRRFCETHDTAKDDVLIILGDAGINLFGDLSDRKLKEKLSTYPITLFCIHGNHDMRPEDVPTYSTGNFYDGKVWIEEEFPNIIFARDTEVYNFCGVQSAVIGGAYSIDRQFPPKEGKPRFDNEQPSLKTKRKFEEVLSKRGWEVNVVLSHTCPMEARPTEVFISAVDQSLVDTSTEEWLSSIAERLSFDTWFFGHFHVTKKDNKYIGLFKDVIDFFTMEMVYSHEDDKQVAQKNRELYN